LQAIKQRDFYVKAKKIIVERFVSSHIAFKSNPLEGNSLTS